VQPRPRAFQPKLFEHLIDALELLHVGELAVLTEEQIEFTASQSRYRSGNGEGHIAVLRKNTAEASGFLRRKWKNS
jgi:hypothetical protein